MNILITSVGRRGYIVDYFKEALGGKGKVIVGNSSFLSPAFSHADEYVITPLIYSDEYIPFLLDYCIQKKINFVISMFDVDLLVLAKNKELFYRNGINLIVSAQGVIEICNDKWKTYEFLTANEINVPRCYLTLGECCKAIEGNEIKFPIVVKPRWGMGSLAFFVANSLKELETFADVCENEIEKSYLKYESEIEKDRMVLFQEYIHGEEYGVDVINDLSGNHVVSIVKKKMSMRAGETDAACVIKDVEIEAISKKISDVLRHIGNLDVDILVSKSGIFVLEMNARFGGGYPFSHMSGIDLPTALIRWVNNNPIKEELTIKEYNQIWHKDIQLIKLCH